MTPESNPKLESWLYWATKGLASDAISSITKEIIDHVQTTLEHYEMSGFSRDGAEKLAVLRLGDPEVFLRDAKKSYLTASENNMLSGYFNRSVLSDIFFSLFAIANIFFFYKSFIPLTTNAKISYESLPYSIGLFFLAIGNISYKFIPKNLPQIRRFKIAFFTHSFLQKIGFTLTFFGIFKTITLMPKNTTYLALTVVFLLVMYLQFRSELPLFRKLATRVTT